MNTLVNFEIAQLLKEKGFNVPTEQGYDYKGEYYCDENWKVNYNTKPYYLVCSAPTIAEVIMWLYENHKIWISCHYHKSGKFSITICDNAENSLSDGLFGELYPTPTEAYEAAIEYTLTNLI
jgi:hypothetical protein